MQIKNTFDKETIEKISKGSVYAGLSAMLVYLLQLSGMDVGEASGLATSIIMAFIGVINYLKTAELSKIGVGLLMAIGSSTLVFLLEYIPNLDFGSLTPLITAISAIILNSVKEYKTDNSPLRY